MGVQLVKDQDTVVQDGSKVVLPMRVTILGAVQTSFTVHIGSSAELSDSELLRLGADKRKDSAKPKSAAASKNGGASKLKIKPPESPSPIRKPTTKKAEPKEEKKKTKAARSVSKSPAKKTKKTSTKVDEFGRVRQKSSSNEPDEKGKKAKITKKGER